MEHDGKLSDHGVRIENLELNQSLLNKAVEANKEESKYTS